MKHISEKKGFLAVVLMSLVIVGGSIYAEAAQESSYAKINGAKLAKEEGLTQSGTSDSSVTDSDETGAVKANITSVWTRYDWFNQEAYDTDYPDIKDTDQYYISYLGLTKMSGSYVIEEDSGVSVVSQKIIVTQNGEAFTHSINYQKKEIDIPAERTSWEIDAPTEWEYVREDTKNQLEVCYVLTLKDETTGREWTLTLEK